MPIICVNQKHKTTAVDFFDKRMQNTAIKLLKALRGTHIDNLVGILEG